MKRVPNSPEEHPLLRQFKATMSRFEPYERRRQFATLLDENAEDLIETGSYAAVMSIVVHELGMGREELAFLASCCGAAPSTFMRHAETKNIPHELVQLQLVRLAGVRLRSRLH